MKGWKDKDDPDFVEDSIRTALIEGKDCELPKKGMCKSEPLLKKVQREGWHRTRGGAVFAHLALTYHTPHTKPHTTRHLTILRITR